MRSPVRSECQPASSMSGSEQSDGMEAIRLTIETSNADIRCTI
jgi:hypothetical protein